MRTGWLYQLLNGKVPCPPPDPEIWDNSSVIERVGKLNRESFENGVVSGGINLSVLGFFAKSLFRELEGDVRRRVDDFYADTERRKKEES